MPELPEVETTVKGLQKVLNRAFVDIWTDIGKFKKLKQLKGKKVKKIWRRGKNIIFEFSDGYSLLIHQKMTGHFLYGNWKRDKANKYIHLKFLLDNKKILALSDLRKFAKAELWKTQDLIKKLSFLGPEPLSKSFTFNKFKEIIKKKGRIKQLLMNQELIAGIGNIYSDEILWQAKVHPFKQAFELTEKELKDIYRYIKVVLKKAVKLGGTSISDYRDTKGEKGSFEKIRKIYRREGENCSRCRTKIKRAKLGSRSTHFCSQCQKLAETRSLRI